MMSEIASRQIGRVLFRADASPQIGTGHVMRCLALADGLLRAGSAVTLASGPLAADLIRRLAATGVSHCLLPNHEPAGIDWDMTTLSPEAQRRDAATTAALCGTTRFDWVVVDHYRLDAIWHRAIRPAADAILVIDDLANRPINSDLVLDQTAGRRAADYWPWLASESRLLLGARYALLRPEFAAARAGALHRRRDGAQVFKVLVSLGGTDCDGITGRVVGALLNSGFGGAIDVVLAQDAPSFPGLVAVGQSNSAVTIHSNVRDMAALTADADLCIGAAGTSSWERCCLGLPTVLMVLANNQRLVAQKLTAIGATVVADTPADAASLIADLAEDHDRRQRMVAAAAAVTGGDGVALVCRALAAGDQPPATGEILARPATEADAEPLWLWRNDPDTRAMAIEPGVVTWPDHLRWFQRRLTDPDCLLLIMTVTGERIGMVRFDRTGQEAVVSINLAPDARGRGLASAILRAGCACAIDRFGAIELAAEIKPDNVASERIFRRNDFIPDQHQPGQDQLICYRRRIPPPHR